MSKEKESYQKIMFWGSLLGNFMLTGLWLAVASGFILLFPYYIGGTENEFLLIFLFLGIVVLFCLPGIKVKRSSEMALNLMYENGESKEEDVLQNIPLILKPFLKQKELNEKELLHKYVNLLKYYTLLLPFLFAGWVYLVFKITALFI